ncbi:GDYXXLXY domain-containing protein [Bordetella avium]|uniref:GDYXXLXY domain-containing protein n=2 Tax=Bordetella avium TaxID=521 RepID=UPI000E0C7BFF|nr:GDYXXLXY domain-containing protein [Bordetella avium]RIQ15135.1 DUF4401 domain-containing protein [Bordetella avium]RIQ38756.1 DUF4401 domain-containing protein [Bordetella avium]RIQ43294.1 DUF4401 domain-containing protein [Bordetella avium]RIQ43769.1 DUF4401 domain-containing protein [Bordetella avium]RIQ53316.1 DUF4401 domain-containing protein [Bordetella avium]
MQVGTTRQEGSELHVWRQFLGRSTLWLGILLLGSGVICWVAANWPGMGKLYRFTLTQGLLAVSVLVSIWLALRLRGTERLRQQSAGAVLSLSGLLLGALLALLGQIYQTGADSWELFAWWALLLLPWALAAGSQVLWLLWCLIVNMALALGIREHVLPWWERVFDRELIVLLVASVNLLMLGIWEAAARRRHVSARVGPRVLALLALTALVAPLLFNILVDNPRGAAGLAWLLVILGMGYFYQYCRRDLVILAMLAVSVICVSLWVVGEWLLRRDLGAWAALPLAALLMAEAVWAAHWLRRLAASGVSGAKPAVIAVIEAGLSLDPASDRPADVAAPARAPWLVQGLLGLSAWLATLLLLVFLFASGLVRSDQGAIVLGLVLTAAGVAVLRTAAGLFWRQCAIAMAFAGQWLVVYSFFSNESVLNPNLFVVLLALAVYLLAPDVLLRFLSGGLIALGMTGLILQALQTGQGDGLDFWFALDTMQANFLWLPVVVLGAWAAAIAFAANQGWARSRPHLLEPLAWALLVSVQGLVWVASGVGVDQLPALWRLHRLTALLNIAGAVLPAVVAFWLLWPRRQTLTRAMVLLTPLALLVLGLFWMPSPGIAFALTWLLLGFGLNKPRLTGFGVLSLLAYLMLYYYQLQVPLLQKSFWLVGAAVLMLLLRGLVWLLPRRARPPVRVSVSPASPAMRRRVAVVFAGLLLVLGVCNFTIYQREQLLAHGQVVILELAPVDPRSLMQGDYMALRFAASTAINKLRAQQDEPDRDGYVILSLDDRGVAQPRRIQASAQPQEASELALRYRVRPDGVRIITNAYFFPEGEGPRYEGARYGEVRVNDQGTGLLLRLLGEDLQPL